ncbi:MAG: hypothetical protein ACREB6_06920 [Rhodospirillales bacterium]
MAMAGGRGSFASRLGFILAAAWRAICRYVAPLAIAWVLISGL